MSKREFLRNCARIRKTSDPDLKSEDPRIPDPDPDPKINFPRIRIRIRIKKCSSVGSGSRIRICIISRIRITSDPKIRSPHSDLRSDIGSYDPCITGGGSSTRLHAHSPVYSTRRNVLHWATKCHKYAKIGVYIEMG